MFCSLAAAVATHITARQVFTCRTSLKLLLQPHESMPSNQSCQSLQSSNPAAVNSAGVDDVAEIVMTFVTEMLRCNAHGRAVQQLEPLCAMLLLMQGSCQGHARVMQGSCKGHARVMQGSCQGHARVMPGSCQCKGQPRITQAVAPAGVGRHRFHWTSNYPCPPDLDDLFQLELKCMKSWQSNVTCAD